jgi:predicted RNA binding protein YcfA (HicA-like mRNA interferase family)
VASYKAKKIQKALAKKGFEERREGHHIIYVYYLDGKKTGNRTFISHGSKMEYNSNLLNKLSKQLNLSGNQLCDLIDCPLTREELQQIYIQKEG